MGLFNSKKKGEPYYNAAADNMLIEGRRQCVGCFSYFVPSGAEHVCSAECAEKSKR